MDPMVNSPLIRPSLLGGVALGGGTLDSQVHFPGPYGSYVTHFLLPVFDWHSYRIEAFLEIPTVKKPRNQKRNGQEGPMKGIMAIQPTPPTVTYPPSG